MKLLRKFRPATISIVGFASLISLGTALLMTPLASTSGRLTLVDALFTATSAACVTGLVVVDMGKDLTFFGQLIVLFMIQIGGLGIMTLSTIFLLLAGGRPSLSSRSLIRDTFTHGGEKSLSSLLLDVVRFTFIIEGLGTVLFCFRFLPDNGLLDGLFLSVFNAVSAFCNAGLTPFSDSFMSFRTDWMINWGLCFLIISGGIGFPVLSELKRQFPFNRRRWRSMSLHTRLILSTTAALLLAGTLLILFMEQGNTLASLPPRERFLAAFFQSVTARTAGFNTLPISQMANETLFVLITLMFIGASSGSCGGGIKTGTFMTLVVMGFSRLRGYEQPQIFQRSISVATVGRAISVVMMSLLVVILGTWLILMTELGDLPHSLSRGKFLELFFEVISAFGTVGLSMGITAVLSTAGKLLITLIMFVGRLGPLVVAIAVSRRKVIPYRYAEESIMVG